jgi:hypothetical protein
MPLGTENNMNTHYEEASRTGKPSKSENQTFPAVSLAGEVASLVSEDVGAVQFAPNEPRNAQNPRANTQTDKRRRSMEEMHTEVTDNGGNIGQEALCELPLDRDVMATIRGVNAIVVEWMNCQDGWVLGDAVSATISMFCDADVMEDAYGTYLERVLQGLRANCAEMTGKE